MLFQSAKTEYYSTIIDLIRQKMTEKGCASKKCALFTDSCGIALGGIRKESTEVVIPLLVVAAFRQKAGTGIELGFDVDPDILGGVVLKVGDKVLDASLRAQLAILRETFKRGE